MTPADNIVRLGSRSAPLPRAVRAFWQALCAIFVVGCAGFLALLWLMNSGNP